MIAKIQDRAVEFYYSVRTEYEELYEAIQPICKNGTSKNIYINFKASMAPTARTPDPDIHEGGGDEYVQRGICSFNGGR